MEVFLYCKEIPEHIFWKSKWRKLWEKKIRTASKVKRYHEYFSCALWFTSDGSIWTANWHYFPPNTQCLLQPMPHFSGSLSTIASETVHNILVHRHAPHQIEAYFEISRYILITDQFLKLLENLSQSEVKHMLNLSSFYQVGYGSQKENRRFY